MKVQNKNHIENLKQAIEQKAGLKIAYAKDCYTLSKLIFDETNRQISETTIKRLWGVVNTKFSPSKYTLDSLAIYIGYENWLDFTDAAQKKIWKDEEPNLWENLKKKAAAITQLSFDSIKSRMGIPYEYTITRNSAIENTKSFLESNKTAMAFVAPGGFGKSTIILKIIENFFWNKNAIYSNDIVWLIDCGIIDKLLTKNFSLENYILHLMGYDVQINPRIFFLRHPELLKGKIIIIIDGLNEISSQNEKLSIFIDNLIRIIASNEHTHWFKFIITCRTNTWAYLVEKISNYPSIKNKWFGVNFSTEYSSLNNILTLNNHEINRILIKNKFHQTLNQVQLTNPEIIEIIAIPYFLQLYINQSNEDKIISAIELLNKFAVNTIVHSNYRTDKLIIINTFLKETNYGLNGDSIKKTNLIDIIKINEAAYNELISYGILHEYEVHLSQFLPEIYIKFSHEILFEYFLTNLWLKENIFDTHLIKKINLFYQNHLELKLHVLKWLIKYLFKEAKTELLKTIFEDLYEIIENQDKEHCIINEIGFELRRYKNIREILIPHFASSESGRKFYFEKFVDIDFLVLQFSDNLDYYLNNDNSAEAQIFAYSLKFWKSFLTLNFDACKKYNSTIINLKNNYSFNFYHLGLTISCNLLYNYFINKNIQEHLIEEIYAIDRIYYDSVAQTKHSPVFQMIIIDSLYFCERYRDIIYLMKNIHDNYTVYQLYCKNNNHKITNLVYAWSLYNSGRKDDGLAIFSTSKEEEFKFNSKYFGLIKFNFLKSEFLIAELKQNEANEYLKQIKEWSSMLGFKYFELKADKLLNSLHHV